MTIDHTHAADASSWVPGADADPDFPVQNLPLGLFSPADGDPRIGTAIGGSSMGGLASLYAMSRNPQVFTAALAYSTHWPIGQNDLVDYYLAKLPRDGKHILWSDRGDLDIDAGYAPFHERFIAGLTQAGWVRDRDFIAAVQYGTGHNENYWARRIEEPINWWLSRL